MYGHSRAVLEPCVCPSFIANDMWSIFLYYLFQTWNGLERRFSISVPKFMRNSAMDPFWLTDSRIVAGCNLKKGRTAEVCKGLVKQDWPIYEADDMAHFKQWGRATDLCDLHPKSTFTQPQMDIQHLLAIRTLVFSCLKVSKMQIFHFLALLFMFSFSRNRKCWASVLFKETLWGKSKVSG